MTLDDAIFVAGKLVIECELLRARIRVLEAALEVASAAHDPRSAEREDVEPT